MCFHTEDSTCLVLQNKKCEMLNFDFRYPHDYQEEFIRDVYYAANVFGLPQPIREP